MTSAERLARFNSRLGRIAFGGDYNPEQWTPEVWAEDMRLMKDAGVSLVSLGIFSWAKVEPRPGEFDFGWVDTIFGMLHDADVAVCMATMTASPPPWLARLHPETLPVKADGTKLWQGARQHYCPSSPDYRRYATRLVEQLANRYGDHPALAMWHINNEYGCHVRQCYCDTSAAAFRDWLRDRYGDIDGLNEAWSTSFWSQGYSEFDEIQPPRSTPTFPNPAQRLDFARFSSDELLACYLAEKEVLDRITPGVPATTNFMGAFKPADYTTWAPHIDAISHDSYPDPHNVDGRSAQAAAFTYDLMRSLGDGAPWMLMEQAPSAVNWRLRNGPKPPGVMRLWSWQAVAHGADSVLYFQWRASRGGAERFHSGMVPHAGPDTRVHREVAALGNELASHPELFGTRQTADAAIVMDWPSWWALEGDSHPSSDINYLETVAAHYGPLYQANVACDVVPPSADLSRYKLLVVPNLYLVTEEHASALERFVREGGTLLMSFFSGIVDDCDRVHLGGYPAPFRDMLGLWTEEFWPLPEGGDIPVAFTGDLDGLAVRGATVWSEDIHLEGAEALAHFDSGPLSGHPALTRHRFGEGTAYYLATRPDDEAMTSIMDLARGTAGVTPVLPGLPDGVQARARVAEDGTVHHIVMNHNDAAVVVSIGDRIVELGGYGVEVVTEN
ncbi:MAG TPA: beta-galactosidase [Stackebrandtia sp.]|uniref:beta-galactosidase n=1 Tax=Stackebrandtia sp. TaxID=2023065 RepID=UPI002D26CC94|nr:beta-galactosidase [Stackebrandtia sp.]HZE39077.1 beta-galactosidase [Stackebrandtia sp.]